MDSQHPDHSAGKAAGFEHYRSMRSLALATPANAVVIPEGSGLRVFGAMMDLTATTGHVTVVGFADGNASFYVSSGGGIIGGGMIPEVREKAFKFVKGASLLLEGMSHPLRDDLPPVGTVYFHAMTATGLRFYATTENILKQKQSVLWPQFVLGHDLIAKLRAFSQQQGAALKKN